MCSLSTRGFWHEIVGAMHELGRSGQITGTAPQLARIGRCTAAEAEDAIAELGATKAANVSERNGIFTIINRRMKREYEERERNKGYVQNHRENKNVRNGKTNVRIEKPSETSENKGIQGENKNGKGNVSSYSSSSSSINLQSGGGTSSARARGEPPPTATAESFPPKEAKAKEARLDDLQGKYPHANVRKVRGKYLDYCQKNGKDPKWQVFEDWLKNEYEPMDSATEEPPKIDFSNCTDCDVRGMREIRIEGEKRMVKCQHPNLKKGVGN